jgi:hypothetical protein
MRGSKAKALRRQAELETRGAPYRTYIPTGTHIVKVPVPITPGFPSGEAYTPYTDPYLLSKKCTRYRIKQLKRESKNRGDNRVHTNPA